MTQNSRFVPTMIFIDGGFLKKWLNEVCKLEIEKFDYGMFSSKLAGYATYGINHPDIIRTFFYDGLADPNEASEKYRNQRKFQEWLNTSFQNFEVRRSELVKTQKKANERNPRNYKQKGVDILMALDMIDKAASNQYELAIVVTCDLDHLETIKAVKARGKQVFGVYDKKYTNEKLIESFDRRHELKEDEEKNLVLPQKDWFQPEKS